MIRKQEIYGQIKNFTVDIIVEAKNEFQERVKKQMRKQKGLGMDDEVIIETQDDYEKLVNIYAEIEAESQPENQPSGIFSKIQQNIGLKKQPAKQDVKNKILINALIAHKVGNIDEPKEEIKEDPVRNDSESQAEKFQHLHPRMLYEIFRHVKDHGSVSAEQMVRIMENFDDLNNENKLKAVTDTEYKRYSN